MGTLEKKLTGGLGLLSEGAPPMTLSEDVGKAVAAAAKAASDMAATLGLDLAKAAQIYAAATAAAVAILDPSGESTAALFGEDDSVSPMQRIENTLARALKANAVRVMDLFRDWDVDNSGSISKAEFRKAMQNLGVEGTRKDHDELFDKWDADNSGELDYNEINKAIRKAQTSLSKDDLLDPDSVRFSVINSTLIGTTKAGDIKALKAAKSKEKVVVERPLSPRSLQLKEAAEREAAQKRAEDLARLAKEEEDGTTWSCAKFLAARGLAKIVASALDLPPRSAGDNSHFMYVRGLSREQVTEMLGKTELTGLVDFVSEAIASLSEQQHGTGEKLNDKFSTTAKFQMTYGSLSLFYGGLESLLGPPKMYKGAPEEEKSLFNMMQYEHLSERDSSVPFESNGGVTTTAETEWAIVVKPNKETDYPERVGYRERHPGWCRVPSKLDDMLQAMEANCNERLRKDGHSEMIKEELVAGRLYTGPMYVKYNTVLRSKSRDPHMLSVAKKLTSGNDYVTTIHATNSCVLKLSKLTKAGKVWRGIKDATLPKEFWVPNEMGVRGGIEYGFSSTTVDREQAMMYAQGSTDKKDGDASTIFEMQMGMVDRGADLTWLSQYPHEREVLLPPLTGIEALATDVEGSMLIIHSRLSLNLAAHTLEQVLSRRRKMLLDMTAGIELEMRDALGEGMVKFGISILKRALEYGPLSRDVEWFNDDENFAHVMQQTLYLQHGIVSEVQRLSADSAELNLKGWSMTGPSRILLLAGWVCHRSANKSTGGDASMSIDLRDAKLSFSEAEQLAELMRRQERLTSVDVRNNESMGKAGADALAKFLDGSAGGGQTSSFLHVPRSLCGVTPSKSTLEVPKSVPEVELRILCSELTASIFSEGISAGMGNRSGKAAVLNRRGASAASEWQPFLWAAKENHRQIVELLLDLGADINQQQPNTSSSSQSGALHWAATKGHEDMAKFLIERGIRKDMRDKHNNTALMLAEKKQHAPLVLLLGGDPSTLKKGPAD